MTNFNRTGINDDRRTVAQACWYFSGVSVLFSTTVAVVSLFADDNEAHHVALYATVLVAWLVLAVMTLAWIRDRRLHWIWPLAGTCAGLPASLVFHELWPGYISTVPLAFYLVYFHLRPVRADSSRRPN
ncbi:MAG TPA: hypothetical protein VIM12_15190 [Noviherbaspirillum sp.]|uniref:hypothetical protein n=1 Tax=Noviherbaspirillum sp. TaxID=1926288 RepID=UPI002F935B6B